MELSRVPGEQRERVVLLRRRRPDQGRLQRQPGSDDRRPPLPDGNGVPDIKDNGNHWTAYGRVNPFNPCLPFADARTCVRYTEFGNKPAPFDGSYNWIVAN